MSSPERMEMHARAIANLVQAMDRMEQEQQSHDRHLQTIEAWIQGHEEWMQSHNEWVQSIQPESRQNRARIREIITELTSMQADIARLDAAS